ncbi:putative Na+/H+ antiporter [Uliginosibacterium sp. 31-16]|uniref:putative Na+/H+ antiporter n=1 Tax=Uliginosibacterium sp. 31-16 TaxID=3068315 RepID=UPI00273EF540|nr:putative Na+/H+ antiporter [Uliginosibacterium sp. 31-16]MDP5240447.1 putative Na+/H+ antiporter [Uliginosibacterium sp. 31-16]
MNHSIEILATALFAIAVLHTFLTPRFEHLAHAGGTHAGVWHFMGEIEAVFGIWAAALIAAMFAWLGSPATIAHLEGLNFTEPMFVFAIMVVAASRPVLAVCGKLVEGLARILPLPQAVARYFIVMAGVPLLGSFITEPAAMTVAALLLREHYYSQNVSTRFKYATLGVLFVNISIGGTLTSFAAPPVLMVAGAWNWDTAFMASTFGWKAAIAVLINAIALTAAFRKDLQGITPKTPAPRASAPWLVTAVHLACLAGVVVFGHHPVVFMAIFLLFLGFADAYERHQDRLILREGLMVALFLAGLVVLGSLQKWWLQPLLADMDDIALFFGALGLTAFTDNAALTYLGSLVDGSSDGFRYALVAGAVTGGGLTVIANAPNPAGFAMLRECFEDGSISPLGLLAGAALPTAVAAGAFLVL